MFTVPPSAAAGLDKNARLHDPAWEGTGPGP